MNEIKIIFSGPMGAGKTTAIGLLSEIAPLRTEVANSDRAQSDKDTTTVALDYGEISLDDGRKLKLFGMPGQDRFGFMRRLLGRNALGAVILLDHSRPDPCADLRAHVDSFPELAASGRIVVGLGRVGADSDAGLAAIGDALQALGFNVPVISVDVRRPADVLLLVELLMLQIETYEMAE